jgi:hypothetical protein
MAQLDLNLACVRTSATLLERLILRTGEASAGDDGGHALLRLFNKYMNTLLEALDLCLLDLPVGTTSYVLCYCGC